MAERWLGSKTLKGGKVHYDAQASKEVITTDFQGPYSECLAKKPKIGAIITGLPSTHKITGVKIVELDGGAGRIDVTLEAAVSDSTFSTEPLGEPTYEIDWVETQRPIELHKNCGKLNPERAWFKDGAILTVEDPAAAGGKQLTWEDWPQLMEASEDNPGGDYLEESASGGPIVWSLENYKGIKEQGQDAYLFYSPVVRRTTIHLRKPADVGDGSGKLQEPPIFVGFARIGDFMWLGGADRCVKSGRTFTRTTEWQGAEFWEPLTYPES